MKILVNTALWFWSCPNWKNGKWLLTPCDVSLPHEQAVVEIVGESSHFHYLSNMSLMAKLKTRRMKANQTVSYTHLDVYKRQICNSFEWNFHVSVSLYADLSASYFNFIYWILVRFRATLDTLRLVVVASTSTTLAPFHLSIYFSSCFGVLQFYTRCV